MSARHWRIAGFVVAVVGSAGHLAGQQRSGCDAAHLAPFQFWVGSWEATDPSGQRAGRDSVAVVLDGCALHETWVGEGGHRGHSYTTYHRSSRTWYQTWVDNAGTFLHLSGGPTDIGEMRLEGTVTGRDGRLVWSRITWSRCAAECQVRQVWEISRDDGETWQVFSDLGYRPVPDSVADPMNIEEENR